MSNHLKLRRVAMDLLARREHSRLELLNKLQKHAETVELVHQVLDELETDNLLNEQRFIESFIQSKMRKGQGPVKISYELKQKGIDKAEITQGYQELTIDWFELAKEVRERKFGDQTPQNAQDKAKQLRFLSQRGFNAEQSYYAIENRAIENYTIENND